MATETATLLTTTDLVPTQTILSSSHHKARILSNAPSKHIPSLRIRTQISTTFTALAHTLQTLHLFTRSDLKTIVLPTLIFGLTNALAAPAYNIPTTTTSPLHLIATRAPLTLIWIYAQLLPFTISNQNSPSAIEEDTLNKPWRPLPSSRITPPQATRLMRFAYLTAILLSLQTGGLRQSLSLVCLGAWYNNFGGSEAHWFIRNLINGLGYICFTSGAMEVTLSRYLPFEPKLAFWFLIIGAVVTSLIHLADMYDQEGDQLRGRKTLPLVVGDGTARWMTMIPMMVWGVACPAYWHVSIVVSMLSIIWGSTIAGRCLYLRTVEDDKKTFLLWNIWMALIFVLPLLSHVGR